MKMLAVFAAAVILQAAPAQAWTGQTAFFMEDFMAAEKLATGKTSDSDEVASLIEKADPAGAEKVFRMLNDRAIEACLPAYRKHYEGLKPEVNSQSDLEKLAAGARPRDRGLPSELLREALEEREQGRTRGSQGR